MARLTENLRTVSGLLVLLWRPPRQWLWANVALLTLNAVLVAGEPLFLGVAVGAIWPVAAGTESASTLALPVATLVVVLLLHMGLLGMSAPLARQLSRAVDGQVRRRLRASVLTEREFASVEDPEVSDAVNSARAGIHGITLGDAAKALVNNVFKYVNAVALCAVIARASAPAAVVLFLAMVAVRIRSISLGPRRSSHQPERLISEQRALYLRDLATGWESAKEVKLFGTGRWLSDKMHRAWLELYGPSWVARRNSYWQFGLLYLGLAVAYAGALTMIVEPALYGRVGVGELAAAISAATGLLVLTSHGDATYPYVGQPVRAYFRFPERHQSQVRSARVSLASDAPTREIRIDNLTFRYPHGNRYVFDGLNLSLRAGESVALVGSNGAGKTTMVKLLAGLYKPESGRILVDGVDLADVGPEAWRRLLAVLFQDFVRYHLPMRDNIQFGAAQLPADDRTLAEVARRAGCAQLTAGLPAGYDTPLSRHYSGGVDLSGGEWQRVALTRALYAVQGGAKVLVLDEPTSALDVRAEEALFSRFLELTYGLTTVLISHRFSAVRRAQRIVVLEAGRIVEDGDHDELMALNGQYARMFTVQARQLRPNSPDSR